MSKLIINQTDKQRAVANASVHKNKEYVEPKNTSRNTEGDRAMYFRLGSVMDKLQNMIDIEYKYQGKYGYPIGSIHNITGDFNMALRSLEYKDLLNDKSIMDYKPSETLLPYDIGNQDKYISFYNRFKKIYDSLIHEIKVNGTPQKRAFNYTNKRIYYALASIQEKTYFSDQINAIHYELSQKLKTIRDGDLDSLSNLYIEVMDKQKDIARMVKLHDYVSKIEQQFTELEQLGSKLTTKDNIEKHNKNLKRLRDIFNKGKANLDFDYINFYYNMGGELSVLSDILNREAIERDRLKNIETVNKEYDDRYSNEEATKQQILNKTIQEYKNNIEEYIKAIDTLLHTISTKGNKHKLDYLGFKKELQNIVDDYKKISTIHMLDNPIVTKSVLEAKIKVLNELKSRIEGSVAFIPNHVSKDGINHASIGIALFTTITLFILVKSVIKGVMKYKDVKSYIRNIKYYWRGYIKVQRNPNLYKNDINKLQRVGYDRSDAYVIIALAKSLPGKEQDILSVARLEYNNYLKNPKIINLKKEV